MSKENGLSKTITEHHDAQSRSEGSWANAWVPVWEETLTTPAANTQPKAEASEPQSTKAYATKEVPAAREAEKVHA
ncbi:MAG: hypothetical protein JXB30_18815 [Anaerolineae bacterium]|nr:hypothetical protein [Anaerolineae bacterium]